ncbi:MAG: hypothetical protein ACF8MJ_06610 [Phycisphaerales bacterium JB050]
MPMMRRIMAGFFTRAMPKRGWVYPFVELALGVLYLLNAFPIATNIITSYSCLSEPPVC